MEGGLRPQKLVLGMPMYGQSFTLKSTAENGLNAPSYEGGIAGHYTRAKGFLAYYEICEKTSNGWTSSYDPDMTSMVAFHTKKKEWVGYENPQTITERCEFINLNGLAGAMFWDLSLDDMNGEFCGEGNFPLINTMKNCLN